MFSVWARLTGRFSACCVLDASVWDLDHMLKLDSVVLSALADSEVASLCEDIEAKRDLHGLYQSLQGYSYS